MVRRGDVWSVGWQAVSVEVATSKGLADLARLIASPGTEIHALDLMGGGVDEAGIDDSIDDDARRRYQDRIRELQDDIEEANTANDLGRIERLEDELDQLVDALTKAYGLGGRKRETGASAEKARSAVTWRIRAAIKKLDHELPALGRHLRASVRTGGFCAYDPELTPDWVVELL